MNLIKKLYKKLFRKNDVKTHSAIKDWEAAGKPVPPPHLVKQEVISSLKNIYQYELFIETGTYLGEMVDAQKNNFKKIYSIELGEDLFRDAVKKFQHQKNITILHGDSGDVLVKLSSLINEPAIFWLDGHYSAGITAKGSKDCPIYEELTAIFGSKPIDHILLIDDARLFIGEDDYPTIAELTDFVKQYRPLSKINVEDDIIKVFLK